MSHPRRAVSACAATAALLVLPVASALADTAQSDADTPTDSPSAWNGVWPWLLLGAGVFIFLFVTAVGVRSWRGSPDGGEPPAEEPPAPEPAAPPRPGQRCDVAVMPFDHIHGAEQAYGDVRDEVGVQPWQSEVAFVEHHHHSRIVVRGMFGGRYLDVEGDGDATGQAAEPYATLLAIVSTDVPEGGSAIVMYAPPDEIDAMADATAYLGRPITRYQLPAPAAQP